MVASIISQERLVKYLRASGHDEQKALELYGWNIQISEAFYPVLNAIEVSLRNIISSRLIEIYGDNWWENDEYLAQIHKGKGIVKRAQDNIRKRHTVSSGRMIAELNFGFWVKMLLPRHEAVFWADFNAVFTNLPDEITYDEFYSRCDAICDIRNRIFHHEPIINRNISQDYHDILEVIAWLSPEKVEWIKNYSRVMTVLREKPKSGRRQNQFNPAQFGFMKIEYKDSSGVTSYYELKSQDIISSDYDLHRLNIYLSQDGDFVNIWFGLLNAWGAEAHFGFTEDPSFNFNEQYNESLFRGFIADNDTGRRVLEALRCNRYKPQHLHLNEEGQLNCTRLADIDKADHE